MGTRRESSQKQWRRRRGLVATENGKKFTCIRVVCGNDLMESTEPGGVANLLIIISSLVQQKMKTNEAEIRNATKILSNKHIIVDVSEIGNNSSNIVFGTISNYNVYFPRLWTIFTSSAYFLIWFELLLDNGLNLPICLFDQISDLEIKDKPWCDGRLVQWNNLANYATCNACAKLIWPIWCPFKAIPWRKWTAKGLDAQISR